MEFEFGKVYNTDTGELATKKETEAFKKKVVKNKKELEERIAKRNESREKFIDKHRVFLKRFLDDEDLNSYDEDDCVYRLSTALFDCGFGRRKVDETKLLKEIKSEFGKKFCNDVLDGFKNGQHDT